MITTKEHFVNDARTASLLTAARIAGTGVRWLMSFILLLAVTTAFFDRVNIAVLFNNSAFHSDIGVSDPTLMGLLMSAFVFSYGISAMLFSITGDYFGPRRTLSAIAAILAAAMALMGVGSSYALMLTGRVTIGITEGPQFGTAISVVKRWFPLREQALGNAVWTIGSPLGSMIGFPLVIFLVAQYGWRASFYVLAALNACIVLPIVWFFLRDRPADDAAMAVASQEKQMPFGRAFMIVMRDYKFWLMTFFNSGVLIYLWGLNAWLPTYLQQARGFGLLSTGFYSSLPFFLMIIGQFLFAWMSDVLGRRALVCGASLFMTAFFLYLTSIVPGATSAAWCIALSAGFWGGTTPALFALGAQVIPAKITAAGFGLYGGIANIIGSFAPLIIGTLVSSTGSFTAGLQFLVACCVVGSLGMIPLIRKY
jgi:sugar phosphate permease